MFNQPTSSVISYYIVKHNPGLFAVMSLVTTKYTLGDKREFKNFVAKASSEEEARSIIKKLETCYV